MSGPGKETNMEKGKAEDGKAERAEEKEDNMAAGVERAVGGEARKADGEEKMAGGEEKTAAGEEKDKDTGNSNIRAIGEDRKEVAKETKERAVGAAVGAAGGAACSASTRLTSRTKEKEDGSSKGHLGSFGTTTTKTTRGRCRRGA